ncbi:thioredoxin family protein [Faecalibacter bovis]|uniref:Thioredoxin family protein n=1 Tax=Faecalibacter bovis TaxID=2898187 RepID=A0ABX7XG32_9FLAO|nr:thioredoxin family protein [Faecalibacter bovis]QTV06818.1 thioredoxin family protein [Faecalibacter bovis]
MRILITVLALFITSITFAQGINWMSLDDATKASNANPEKPILFNIYTNWCGYCKKLDKETFVDPAVVKYVNENYIPVKFNAETKEMVSFLGINFTYIAGAKANYLAYVMTNGRLSYPATVILDNKGNTDKIILGYRSAENFTSDIKI